MASRPDLHGYREPVRALNAEILSRLTLEDNTVRPLPGAVRIFTGSPDSRLKHLDTKPVTRSVCFYEHLATIRYRQPGANRKFDQFFVCFRQTMDALLLEQQGAEYPLWLMEHPVKKTELKIYIYLVTRRPKDVPNLQSHEDWSQPIADSALFDTLAHFLLKNHIITEEMYGKLA